MDFAWVQRDFVMLEVGKVTSLVEETEQFPHSQGTAMAVFDEYHEIRFRVDQPLALLWIPVSLPFFGIALICIALAGIMAYSCMHGSVVDWVGLGLPARFHSPSSSVPLAGTSWRRAFRPGWES